MKKHLFSHPTFESAISLLLCIVFVVHITACGTIMYPERRGLTRDPAQLDVKVVVMDGALLLFFILPGVIAYAVDFSTGCIYLPPGQIMRNMDELDPADMQVLRVSPELLSSEVLPDLIAQHTGVSIAAHANDMQIFRPDSTGRALDIPQALTRLFSGQAPQVPGTWYAGDRITLIADADGRVTNVNRVVLQEAELARK